MSNLFYNALRVSKVNGISSVFKYSILGGIGSLVLSIILLGTSGYFTQKWYAESIKTKEEIRSELLKEFENKGKGIYDVKSYEKLQYNPVVHLAQIHFNFVQISLEYEKIEILNHGKRSDF